MFETQVGYSRAVIDGDWVFVSGCTGFDYQTMAISDDIGEQTHQAFRNVQSALTLAGAKLSDIVRIRYYLVNQADWPSTAPILGQYMAEIRPAATALICGLIDPRMKIEVEVTAKKRAS